tara:strand:+ start:632 stop:991 length:360 start_codon:yes stop_codon:yes gene_type:complete
MEQEISRAVIAISIGDEIMSDFNNVVAWFNSRGYEVEEDYMVSKDYKIEYTYFEKLGVLSFAYEGDIDLNFPEIIFSFISYLKDTKGTSISIAEQTFMGFETLIDLPLGLFRKNVLEGE